MFFMPLRETLDCGQITLIGKDFLQELVECAMGGCIMTVHRVLRLFRYRHQIPHAASKDRGSG